MFVGHYTAAFLLKAKEPKASLGMLFIAVQFVDILFFPFVLLGIERLQLVEHFNDVNNYNLEYMPFTHGLLGSTIWAILWYLVYRFIIVKEAINAKNIAMVMALGVLSHWFADLIAHTPDLPLINGEPKFGFGLWRNKLLTFVVEATLLCLSLYFYLQKVNFKNKRKYYAIAFCAFLIFANFLSFYILPPETNKYYLTISALASYGIFAGMAFWLDRKII